MINRFIEAQQKYYDTALAEIKAGKKQTHWIWFIFPQMRGLGRSKISEYYGIRDRAEAKEYIENPLLRNRLIECATAAYYCKNSVYDIFGSDAIKVRSSMKLFSSVSDISIFKQLLDKF